MRDNNVYSSRRERTSFFLRSASFASLASNFIIADAETNLSISTATLTCTDTEIWKGDLTRQASRGSEGDLSWGSMVDNLKSRWATLEWVPDNRMIKLHGINRIYARKSPSGSARLSCKAGSTGVFLSRKGAYNYHFEMRISILLCCSRLLEPLLDVTFAFVLPSHWYIVRTTLNTSVIMLRRTRFPSLENSRDRPLLGVK